MSSEHELDFTHRVAPSELPELMDGECSYEEFRACLRSLEQLNRLLLGYRPTLQWLRRRPSSHRGRLHLLDVGCGGGDLLRRIARWATRHNVPVKLTGIDLNPYAERAARAFTPAAMDITWITGDALTYQSDTPVNVVVSSLMAHHLEEEQIITLLRWMDATAGEGWFINDLERSERSYRLFGWLARVAGWHRFVQHDGPVSIRRALRADDWERLLKSAGIARDSVTIEHWRPGRLCVGRWK